MDGFSPRRDRTIQEHVHNTYRLREKLREPSVCPQCGVVFHKGRWGWNARPPGAEEVLCQACHRINDHYPQGLIRLTGPFFAEHKDEVLNAVRNQEAQERAEHPLSRIMSIRDEAGDAVVETTDVHLPRRIGEALHHAYHGALTFHYDEDEQFIRVQWSR